MAELTTQRPLKMYEVHLSEDEQIESKPENSEHVAVQWKPEIIASRYEKPPLTKKERSSSNTNDKEDRH